MREILLEKISDPKEIRRMGLDELEALAEEIRRRIIEVVSRNGGHLAPNLGTVELTIALHRTFDSPKDKLVWDTGHQAYTHKLLTGRNNKFDTLRKMGGISGFLKRRESPHDVWEAGHLGTALSGALGMALARDLKGEDNFVVAVVGDGALTCGLSLEALNNIGMIFPKKFIIVINNNEWSISPTRSALLGKLTRVRTSASYLLAKGFLKRRLSKALVSAFSKATKTLREAVLEVLNPRMELLEAFGIRYFGPVDGHDIRGLLRTFRALKEISASVGPVAVEVRTVKGKGYKPAEENPEAFHSVPPFNPQTGEIATSGRTWGKVLGERLVKLAEGDPKVVAIVAAMARGTGLKPFFERFPDRAFDVGIAEEHAVTLAAGLASQGFKPFVAVYSTFIQRGIDEAFHDVGLQGLPVTFCLDRAGLVPGDGETHHGVYDIGLFATFPNFVIASPADTGDLNRLLDIALKSGRPFVIRYPKEEAIPGGSKRFGIGQSEIVKDGEDVVIAALGPMVSRAIEAAQSLSSSGVSAAVVNLRFAKPLDGKLLSTLARRCRNWVVVEEHSCANGVGAMVAKLFLEEGLHVRLMNLGVPDKIIGAGTREELLESVGLTPKGIAEACKNLVEGQ